MSPGIRRAVGLCSSCGKPFRTMLFPGSSYSITTRSMDGKPRLRFDHEDRLRATHYPEPLAERRCRALGEKLPPRAARLRYCSERAAFEATCFRLHLLLSRGPNTSRAAQANPGGQKLCRSPWSGDLSATLEWVGPPLRSRCLSSTFRQAAFLELVVVWRIQLVPRNPVGI